MSVIVGPALGFPSQVVAGFRVRSVGLTGFMGQSAEQKVGGSGESRLRQDI